MGKRAKTFMGALGGAALLCLAVAAPAQAETRAISPVGEIHYCNGVLMEVISGQFTLNESITTNADGSFSLLGSITIEQPIQLVSVADRKNGYLLKQLGGATTYSLLVTDTAVTGTFSTHYQYSPVNKPGSSSKPLGQIDTVTTYRADGTTTVVDNGSCGVEPVVTAARLAPIG